MLSTQIDAQAKKLYDTDAIPSDQFQKAIKEAKQYDKHIMVQIGGNWCPWCFRFHDFHTKNPELDSILNEHYILINVSYDPKMKDPLYSRLGYPQRFGFPVLVITNKFGNRIHTQNSWYLEDGENTYDYKKFKSFLVNWSPVAVDPESYDD